MKKRVGLIMILMLILMLTGCGDDDNDCGMCNGSGYYQKKTCPVCHGSGHSDYDPYEEVKKFYGN